MGDFTQHSETTNHAMQAPAGITGASFKADLITRAINFY